MNFIKQAFVAVFSRTEIRLLLWAVLLITLVLGTFTDLYVIFLDFIHWFK